MLKKITPKTFSIFEELYFTYNNTLSKYSERIRQNPITQKDIKDIYINPLLKKYFILNEDNNPIGFFLLGIKENTQPGTDWYIAEFYIKSEYSRQGYGTKAIKRLFTIYPGIYCYFVLKENTPAHKFWAHIKTKFNCIDLTADYDATPYTPEDCTFFAFKTP